MVDQGCRPTSQAVPVHQPPSNQVEDEWSPTALVEKLPALVANSGSTFLTTPPETNEFKGLGIQHNAGAVNNGLNGLDLIDDEPVRPSNSEVATVDEWGHLDFVTPPQSNERSELAQAKDLLWYLTNEPYRSFIDLDNNSFYKEERRVLEADVRQKEGRCSIP